MRNRAENQVILAFIRHGETLANAQRRYLGKTDESLSACGIQSLLSYKRQNRRLRNARTRINTGLFLLQYKTTPHWFMVK